MNQPLVLEGTLFRNEKRDEMTIESNMIHPTKWLLGEIYIVVEDLGWDTEEVEIIIKPKEKR